jgi:hypothetical protein
MQLRHTLLGRLGIEFLGGDDLSLQLYGPTIAPECITTIRTALFGACLAAGAARRDLGPGPVTLLVEARADTTRAAFDVALSEEPLRLDQLLAHFVPAAFLYASNRVAQQRIEYMWGLDRVSPPGCLKNLTAMANVPLLDGSEALTALGDTFLMPPAVRGEGVQRTTWAREVNLDPPRRRDLCGPFWRLGRRNEWRLNVISWHERMILAALLGTTFETCVVLAPAAHFPRVGFVYETAQRFGRTIVCVPLEEMPERLRERLESTRRTNSRAEAAG